jgi:hypothetical protein
MLLRTKVLLIASAVIAIIALILSQIKIDEKTRNKVAARQADGMNTLIRTAASHIRYEESMYMYIETLKYIANIYKNCDTALSLLVMSFYTRFYVLAIVFLDVFYGQTTTIQYISSLAEEFNVPAYAA